MTMRRPDPQHPNFRRAAIRTHVERMCRNGETREDIHSYVHREMAGPAQVNNNWGLRTEADFWLSRDSMGREIRWVQEPGGTNIDFNERIAQREMVDIDVSATLGNKIPRLLEYNPDVVIAYRTPGSVWDNGGWGDFDEIEVSELISRGKYFGHELIQAMVRAEDDWEAGESITDSISEWFSDFIRESFGREIEFPSIDYNDLLYCLFPPELDVEARPIWEISGTLSIGMEVVGVTRAFQISSISFGHPYDYHDIELHVRGLLRVNSNSFSTSWVRVLDINNLPMVWNEEDTPSRTPDNLFRIISNELADTYNVTCIGVRTISEVEGFDSSHPSEPEVSEEDEFHPNPDLVDLDYDIVDIESVYEL